MSDDLNDTPQPLMWELHLPSKHEEAARARCEAKGRNEFALYESSSEYAYFLSMIAFTTILDNYIKLVHFDDGMLSIFMTQPFTPEDTALLKRIFDGNTEYPDILLHDILKTDQARFCVREVHEDGTIHQTIFNNLTPYEGEVNFLGLQDQLRELGVDETKGTSIIYTVESISINEWSGTTIDYLPVVIRGNTGVRQIDVIAEAQRANADRNLLAKIINEIDLFIIALELRQLKEAKEQKKEQANAKHKAKKAAAKAKREGWRRGSR